MVQLSVRCSSAWVSSAGRGLEMQKAMNRMGWREKLNRATGPGVTLGITTGDWLKLLAANGFEIPPRYWGRTAFATLVSLVNTAWYYTAEVTLSRTVARQNVLPPLFILGHWRCGTSHLHNLLALDSRFAYPNFAQIMIPKTFLTAERVMAAASRLFLPRARMGVDDMAMNASVPWEEEFAMGIITQMSPYLAFAFPRRARYYERYLTFSEVPAAQVSLWKGAFITFLKKLTWKFGRPLILKSPPNTCRIKLILEMFPDARFVHIHRDPYVVYQSTRHLQIKCWENCALQSLDQSVIHDQVIRQYRIIMDSFFNERRLIPPERFCEVSYHDIEKEPVHAVRSIYEKLNLPAFTAVEPAVETYVKSLSDYRKNAYVDLPADVRNEISRTWKRSFDEWNYPIQAG